MSSISPTEKSAGALLRVGEVDAVKIRQGVEGRSDLIPVDLQIAGNLRVGHRVDQLGRPAIMTQEGHIRHGRT